MSKPLLKFGRWFAIYPKPEKSWFQKQLEKGWAEARAYECSDAELLAALMTGRDDQGWYQFSMNWSVRPDALYDDAAVAHELRGGMEDLAHQMRRARVLLAETGKAYESDAPH